MSLWMLFVLLGLIKLPIAGLMLWLPFRSDAATSTLADENRSDADGDGGSKTLPGSPTEPHPRLPLPRRPRRGPHGSPSPARVRSDARRVVARSLV